MPLVSDLLDRKSTHFVLWRAKPQTDPTLVIGRFRFGNPPALDGLQTFPLTPLDGFADLLGIAASDCNLTDGLVYHYWFEIDSNGERVRCTDPAAYTVDWRIPASSKGGDLQPAAVIKFAGGRIVASDPFGESIDFTGDPGPALLPRNSQIVIYEMPAAWSRLSTPDDLDIGVGTFRDVNALIDPAAGGANFSTLGVTQPGQSYLVTLGVNALELLPAADSFFKREWGYDTSHYLAPDADLGFPEGFSASTANQDLAVLVRSCHQQGIRFFIDVVMAFCCRGAYQTLNFDEFFIDNPSATPSDPDAHTSRGDGGFRDGFGSTLFRYAKFVDAYDPISGTTQSLSPGRQHMLTYITRWMRDFRVDGVRMDSVENVANWDFVQAFKDRARALFGERFAAATGSSAGADERFLVVGEELSEPQALLTQNRLDGLWHDSFRAYVRAAIIGQNADVDFETTVRKMIDCREFGYTDGTQAVNYITSHDVEGFGRERLYNYLLNNNITALTDIERRGKLAFVCLLTAVGVPMILAGDEFLDEHDRFDRFGHVTQAGGKQVDPVNYGRLEGTDDVTLMRQRVLAYVSTLIHLRASHPSLAVNDTNFIHTDFSDGKRVLVWQRGGAPVVVVANFSDFVSPGPNAEYVIPNFPATPAGRTWREVTQNRAVPPEWIGREPLFAWEAKVYILS